MALSYQKELAKALLGNSILCIARGLGVEEVLRSYLESTGGLVLLIGFEKYHTELLGNVVDTSECRESARKALYKQECFLAGDSETFLKDILSGYLFLSEVRCVFFYGVEKFVFGKSESFVLEILRRLSSSNANIQYKLICEKLERMDLEALDSLGVDKVLSAHRQSPSVKSELSHSEWTIVNINVDNQVIRIKNLLKKALSKCICEIIRSNSGNCDLKELSLDSAILELHYQTVKKALRLKLKNMPLKTQELLTNIKEVRNLLNKLEYTDSVDFLDYLLGVIETKKLSNFQDKVSQGVWSNLSYLDELLEIAKSRVFLKDTTNPYWSESLNLIKQILETQTAGVILVVLPNFEAKLYFEGFLNSKLGNKSQEFYESRLKNCLSRSGLKGFPNELEELTQKYPYLGDLQCFNVFNKNYSKLRVFLNRFPYRMPLLNWEIHVLHSCQLKEHLELNPTHVLLLTSKIQPQRDLEVYLTNSETEVTQLSCALWDLECSKVLEAYEQKAFNELSSQVVVPTPLAPIQSLNKSVVVDQFEFRGQLPYYLFQKGFKLIPKALKTGDYVLSPYAIIERKSFSTGDLKVSINCGRLQSQLHRMIRHYTQCYLLIEFEEHSRFSLTTNSSGFKLCQKLAQLARDCKVQLLWSSSPEQSAEIISKLKQHLVLEPDVFSLSNTQKECSKDKLLTKLLKLPGMDSHSLNNLLLVYPTPSLIAKASLKSLTACVPFGTAKALYSFLHI